MAHGGRRRSGGRLGTINCLPGRRLRPLSTRKPAILECDAYDAAMTAMFSEGHMPLDAAGD
jgi:hypothetical protein